MAVFRSGEGEEVVILAFGIGERVFILGAGAGGMINPVNMPAA